MESELENTWRGISCTERDPDSSQRRVFLPYIGALDTARRASVTKLSIAKLKVPFLDALTDYSSDSSVWFLNNMVPFGM